MSKSFIPAAHYHFLTPSYEALAKPFARKLWRRIAEEAAVRAPTHSSIIDIGCGPGTVLRIIRKQRPDLHLTGIDIDPEIIATARRKADGMNISFVEGSADTLPVADRSADTIISSLVFHHLSTDTKRAALRGVRRILRPGGRFLLCDFSLERGTHIPWWVKMFVHFESEMVPQLSGELIELGHNAGVETRTLWTMYGCVSLHEFTFPITP